MRTISLRNPFVQGMLSDQPDHSIGPMNSAFAQDLFSPNGVARNRQGWAYDGTTADVAANLVGVYRAQFALADLTRTMTCDENGSVYVHNAAAAGTEVYDGDVIYLPRCMYHDELILCGQDGQTPLLRYSGAAFKGPLDDGASVGDPDTPSGQAIIKDLSFASDPGSGSYVRFRPSDASLAGIEIIARVLESSTSEITLEDVRAGQAGAFNFVHGHGVGTTYPCVGVYSAGTVTTNGNTVTGVGTKWDTGPAPVIPDTVIGDGILIVPVTGDAEHRQVGAAGHDTVVTAFGRGDADHSTGQAYQITRRCPFKDAAAHKESLWGTGVAQFPNRVYVSPPGWNPSFPPGATLPFDIFGNDTSPNANDFLLDFIDVPAPTDGDHNVAILSSPNPLLVLKRHAVYGVFGSYGGLSVDLIADGIGCIDIRSAQSYDEGQFWCGEGGIYMYSGGRSVDLTAGKINREWRALTRQFDYGTSDYCSLWMASGHLFVHITTGAGTVQRTYVCDLRDGSWQSRFTNLSPRYGFTSRIPGEKEKALVVQDIDQGRVIDTAPMVDGSGSAKDGDGTAPRMQAWTTSAMGQAGGIAGQTRLVDLYVHGNVYDAGAAGSTQVGVSVVSSGGPANQAASTKTLSDINSDTTDDVNRHKYRVAKAGRFHQVRIDNDVVGTDSNATKVEIHQIDVTLRDNRPRS